MTGERLRGLDGLRGVAALVVVIHHTLLTVPGLAASYFDGALERGSWQWWLSFSPLHLVWAGGEAVVVFFVLSGFVLALPITDREPDWNGYFPKRFVRLYVPVWVAIVIASVVVQLLHEEIAPTFSPWMQFHSEGIQPRRVFDDALLVVGAGHSNTVLWSLQWEVVFSALLPMFVVTGRLGRTRPAWGLLIGFAAIALGHRLQIPAVRYLAVFHLGVVLAFMYRDRIVRPADPQRPTAARPSALSSVLLVAALLVGLTSQWCVRMIDVKWSERDWRTIEAGAFVVVAVCSCAVVWLLAVGRLRRTRFDGAVAQWLGSRSFSLYLVHEPIVLVVGVALGPDVNPALALTLVVPCALLAAEGFHRLIERASMRWASRVGAAAVRLVAASTSQAR